MNLIAIINDINRGKCISWGKDTEFDDWATPFFELSITQSSADSTSGYRLNKLTLYGEAYEFSGSNTEPVDALEQLCMQEGSVIRILGPLYRGDVSDVDEWCMYALSEEPQIAYSHDGEIRVWAHTPTYRVPGQVIKLPALTLKTAESAKAILRERPVVLVTDSTAHNDYERKILETLRESGIERAREIYFT